MKKSDQKILIILAVVTLVHVGAMSWFALGSRPNHLIQPAERLLVNTVVLNENKPKKAPKKQEPPKKVTKKTPKMIEKKKPATEKKKEVDPKKAELLAKAKENLSKVLNGESFKGQKSESSVSNLQDLGKIDALKIDSVDVQATEDMGYAGSLASCLRKMLCLPEQGEVKVCLTLDRRGNFVDVEFLGSKSAYNEKYLEKTIPGIKYPPFGKSFENEPKHSFIITLTNDS